MIYRINGSTKCASDPSKNYSMEISILCDRTMEKGKGKFDNSSETTDCDIKVKATANEACPYFSLMYLFKHNALIFFIIFIGAGIFVTFLGEKLFHFVLFLLTTFLVTFVILIFVTQVILSSTSPYYAFWVTLGLSGVAGITLGYFVYVYEEYCFALAGAFLGGVLGMFICNLLLAKYVSAVKQHFAKLTNRLEYGELLLQEL